MLALFFSLSLIGQTAFWVAVDNRVHSLGGPRWLIKVLTKLTKLLALFGGLFWLVPLYHWLNESTASVHNWQELWTEAPAIAFYGLLCLIPLTMIAGRWLRNQIWGDPLWFQHSFSTERVQITERADEPLLIGPIGKLATLWPGNEITQLQVEQHEFELPRLPAALAGLRIAHLSDLHMTGYLTQSFFEQVVELTNAQKPDLIFISGDLVDEAKCIAWLPETLGRLRARYGVFYVLGNHDLRSGDLPRLHKTLQACGIQDLGGAWKVLKVQGEAILLAGNELPWLGPAADLSEAPQTENGRRLFRILVSHSPDQWPFAQRGDFDLLLAGHTHGGQIAFPLIGPIFTPSWYGVRFAGGTFKFNELIMHVSRGTGSFFPIRWNARPEMSILTLVTSLQDIQQPLKSQNHLPQNESLEVR